MLKIVFKSIFFITIIIPFVFCLSNLDFFLTVVPTLSIEPNAAECDAQISCRLNREIVTVQTDGGTIVFMKDDVIMYQYAADNKLTDSDGNLFDSSLVSAVSTTNSLDLTHTNFASTNDGAWKCGVTFSDSTKNVSSEAEDIAITTSTCDSKYAVVLGLESYLTRVNSEFSPNQPTRKISVNLKFD